MTSLRWLAVAAAAFVATLDLNAYKDEVRAVLEDATGRHVEIAGPLDVSWLPLPSLTASGVRIANAEWGTDPAMVTIGRLAVDVDVAPLLSGDLVLRGLTLADVQVRLERGPDGQPNWIVEGSPAGSASGRPAMPDIRQLDLTDVTVIWRDGPKAPERVHHIKRLTLDGKGPNAPLTMTLLADLDGEVLELTGTLPTLAEIGRPGADLPVDVEGTFAGSALALVAKLQSTRGPKGALSGVRAEGLSATLGELAVTGTAAVDLSKARPRIEARLEAKTVDLAQLGSGASAGGDPLDRRLPVDMLPALDGRIEIAIARLIADPWTIDSLTATATLADGVLTLDPVKGTLAEGTVEGWAALDATKQPARFALAGSANRMDMGRVYRTLTGESVIEGLGDAVVDVHGRGETLRTLLGSSGGVTRLVIRDGTVMNRYWELIAEDLATRFIPFVGEGGRGRLNCLVSRFDIANGIADATVLMIDSDRVTVGGEGTVDLVRQTLDMRLVPLPKDPSLFSLATPILLKGPISDPRPSPDPIAVAKGLGSLAAGAVVGPFALLLPFVSPGASDNPCPDAIAAAEGKRSTAKAKARQEPDKPGGIKGFFDNLRKSIE
jgi:AsmA family protein